MDVVAEIKGKLDLVEYIGRTTKLAKAGRNFRGLCPFHTEKTPSFYVFPDRGHWRCFGSCGEGGDLFSFVQKRENVDFRTSLRELADEAGVQLSAESAEYRGRVEKLSAIMSAAVAFYQQRLQDDTGAAAREYLMAKRGLQQRAIDAFRIGWAPEGWRNLRDYLTSRGYDERDIVAAGLLVDNENASEPYDRFRGRVIIPIADERGQYVAMGGRGLHGEEPKYLNSPQTELFDKGRTLFGLDLATRPIHEAGTAVVVEGYMDVIGPWQAGFTNVVATMGTSLTEHHAALLKRQARRVVLAMDPDAAGLAAAERAGGLFIALDSPENMARSAHSADELASRADLDLRVAPLPPGRDPDEIARDEPKVWESAIRDAPPYAEFLLNRIMGGSTPDSPAAAREVVDRLRPVLQAVRDPVERSTYIQRIARRLSVSEDAVLERVRQGAPHARPRPAGAVMESAAPSPEDALLAILLRYPHLRSDFRNYPATLFTSAIGREVFQRWVAGEDFDLAPNDDPVVAHARAAVGRRLPPLSHDDARTAAQRKAREILRERVMQHQAALTEEVAAAERELGSNAVAALSHGAWLGEIPIASERSLAETMIEDLQLGLSIHRREQLT
jgi:DNA primase